MSYNALTKRLTELRAAASTPTPSCTCDADDYLHRPYCKQREARDVRERAYIDLDWPHEMAACVEALVELLSKGSVDHQAVGADGNSGNRACPVCNARAALDALAKVLL